MSRLYNSVCLLLPHSAQKSSITAGPTYTLTPPHSEIFMHIHSQNIPNKSASPWYWMFGKGRDLENVPHHPGWWMSDETEPFWDFFLYPSCHRHTPFFTCEGHSSCKSILYLHAHFHLKWIRTRRAPRCSRSGCFVEKSPSCCSKLRLWRSMMMWISVEAENRQEKGFQNISWTS